MTKNKGELTVCWALFEQFICVISFNLHPDLLAIIFTAAWCLIKRVPEGLTWWYLSVIPATWKVENRKIVFQGQSPWQKVSETLSQKQARGRGTCNLNYAGDTGRKIVVWGGLNKNRRPILKITKNKKRTGGVVQVVEGLLIKCKDLNSSPRITKEKKKKKRIVYYLLLATVEIILTLSTVSS
jgi:hypothetical protein